MSEVKNRKKLGSKGTAAQPEKPGEGGKSPEKPGGGGWADPRTALSLLSLGTCLGLAWLVFQQSEKFAKVENQYQLLQIASSEFQGLHSKISSISEKLATTESILQEAASSTSLMTQFEQEVSALQRFVHDIQNSEEMLTEKMQNLNEKFQNITDFWKRTLAEMNDNTVVFKSEAKHIHSQVTVQINSVEQEMKLLTERLKDLEHSTLRNVRTVKRQEEDDLLQLEEQLSSNSKAVEKLEEEQHALLARDEDLTTRLSDYEPKVEECKYQKCEALMEQLKSFQIIAHLKHLQEEISDMKIWSNRITENQDLLDNNLTALSQDITKAEQSTASLAKDVSLKITTVKTDIRRISGLVTEVASLTDSVKELESKIETVETITVKNIGDVLSSSIDRTAALRKTASENSQRIKSATTTLTELQNDFDKHTDRFLSLESDRAKVLKTVTFANDLKPKIYNLKKDFSRLEPLVKDLTLRIGRLATDLLQREKELALLNEKMSNLTVIQAEIKDIKEEITRISD